ncbi:hypothetical protein A3860_17620 [Niastella vici]|uniref:Uncharacterized protein n=1 Tax=Niastella vici TaxID=1703345 RepID=A0A1V9G4C8_9BACT|nr:hypothetical protein [Niastella vici]OQP65483.1 hypothetical protein A3860_17620 [Niastella vici]
MSDFLDKLENHRQLLQERGYDEVGLGSPDEPGHFMKRLEYLFSNCVAESRLHSKTEKDFFIDAYGFFNNDMDLVAFTFHYVFDPANKDIELKSFIARMDGIKRPFLLDRNMYDLPKATRVHQILCDERQLRTAREIINHEPEMKNRLKI